MPKITRRSALFTAAALASTSSAGCNRESPMPLVNFNHGVASGDPTANSLILWTRVTPQDVAFNGAISGQWEASMTEDFKGPLSKGKFITNIIKDYTVKIDAKNLNSGQVYFYRFKIGKIVSPIGRGKTLPSGRIDKARFAVVSCSNYPFGFFNVYDDIASQDHFDAVVHLGDYFYEYGREGYGGKVGTKLGREHEPAHEVISLGDYRARHGQYKKDKAAQAMHAAYTIIAVWDDHETANDSWSTGAQNHNPGEGSWDERRANAMQAYYEWMPVRDPAPGMVREACFAVTNLETCSP